MNYYVEVKLSFYINGKEEVNSLIEDIKAVTKAAIPIYEEYDVRAEPKRRIKNEPTKSSHKSS